MKFLYIIFFVHSGIAIANPKISWNYYNGGSVCHSECRRQFLGQCIEWEQVCDRRTKDFTQSHKDLIKEAMNRLSRRIDNSSVINCVKEYRRKSFGVSAQTAKDDYKALRKSSWWPKIHLTAYRDTTRYTGQAEVSRNIKNVEGEYLKWTREPQMEINLSAIEVNNRDLGSDRTADILSGTIVHEFLHQMGHTHPRGYNDGNFITVVGDCVSSNGIAARNAPAYNLTGGISALFKFGPK